MDKRRCILSSVVAVGILLGVVGVHAEEEKIVVGKGKKVKIDYTLTVDGQKVDSSDERGPLEYTQGQGQIIPGLEKEMEGLMVGDSKKVVVAPKDWYGEVNPEAFREVPQAELPQDIPLEAGKMLSVTTPQGQVFPVMIAEVKEDSVRLNLNHPLAGKELYFDVTVVSIE